MLELVPARCAAEVAAPIFEKEPNPKPFVVTTVRTGPHTRGTLIPETRMVGIELLVHHRMVDTGIGHPDKLVCGELQHFQLEIFGQIPDGWGNVQDRPVKATV